MSKITWVLRVASYLAVAAMAAGCGTTPSSVKMPRVTVLPTANKDDDLKRYQVWDYVSRDYKDLSSVDSGMMPVEKTIGGIKAQIWAHQLSWRSEQTNLSKGVDGLNNTAFGGVLLSGLGAVASSVDVAKTGLGIAGGASIWSNHYQLSVQADNYKLAADAMECMYQRVDSLPSGFWGATYVTSGDTTGEMTLSRAAFMDDDNAKGASSDLNAAYDTLHELFSTINVRVNDIRSRLIAAQAKVKIATPSPTDIQNALTNANKNEGQAAKAATDLKSGADKTAKIALERPQEPAPARASAPSPAESRLLSQIKRFDAVFSNSALDERTKTRTAAQKFAELPTETIKKALKLPDDLTVCTKLIGG